MKTEWKVLAPPLVIVAGAALGILGVILAKMGNPPNMGLCVACFQRDIVGALGLHQVIKLQYLRPEIPGVPRMFSPMMAIISRSLTTST